MYDLAAFKRVLDPVLAERFAARLEGFRSFAADPTLESIVAHAGRIMLSGGKRVRPYLAYLSHLTLAPDEEPLLRAYSSLEFFHAFALVHDDLMDRGSRRHGEPTIHEFARTILPAHANAPRAAEAQAILVGDLLYAWSRSELTMAVSPDQLVDTTIVFDAMADQVVAGQMLDVATITLDDPSPEMVDRKTLLKTGFYTFVDPMHLGGRLARHEDETYYEWARRLGLRLGMAFQMQDDLLDARGADAEMGKRTLNDVREGQHTLLSAFVRAHGSAADRAALASAFGAGEAPIDEEAVRAAFERSGALDYAEARIAERLTEAEALVADAPFPAERRAPWQAFIERMRGRVR